MCVRVCVIHFFSCSYLKEFGFTIPDRAIVVDDIRVRGCGKSGIKSVYTSQPGHGRSGPITVLETAKAHVQTCTKSNISCLCKHIIVTQITVVHISLPLWKYRWLSVTLRKGIWTPVCICGRSCWVAATSQDQLSSLTKTGRIFLFLLFSVPFCIVFISILNQIRQIQGNIILRNSNLICFSLSIHCIPRPVVCPSVLERRPLMKEICKLLISKALCSITQYHPGGAQLWGLLDWIRRRLLDGRLRPCLRPRHRAQRRPALHLLSPLHEHSRYVWHTVKGVRTEAEGLYLRRASLLPAFTEQMGRVLQRTSISTNIKERLDFSCAVFGPDGGLVSNAPHIPVHLGAMQETVQYQVRGVYALCGGLTREIKLSCLTRCVCASLRRSNRWETTWKTVTLF